LKVSYAIKINLRVLLYSGNNDGNNDNHNNDVHVVIGSSDGGDDNGSGKNSVGGRW